MKVSFPFFVFALLLGFTLMISAAQAQSTGSAFNEFSGRDATGAVAPPPPPEPVGPSAQKAAAADEAAKQGVVVQLGDPEPAKLTTISSEDFPDIWTRQYKYKVVANDMTKLLAQRQQSFALPEKEAFSNYWPKVKDLGAPVAGAHMQ